MKIVKAVAQNRPVRADEWALRQGMSIAKKHMQDASFEQYSALACDIAEAIQSAWNSMGGTVLPERHPEAGGIVSTDG